MCLWCSHGRDQGKQTQVPAAGVGPWRMGVCVSIVPVAGASVGPGASSWIGTAAPGTSNWGDWDPGVAAGQSACLSPAAVGVHPVHTCSHQQTSILLSQTAEEVAEATGSCGCSVWPAMYTYTRAAYISCVHTGNTFSASLLARLGMQSSSSLASLGLLDLAWYFLLHKYVLEVSYFLISASKLRAKVAIYNPTLPCSREAVDACCGCAHRQ